MIPWNPIVRSSYLGVNGVSIRIELFKVEIWYSKLDSLFYMALIFLSYLHYLFDYLLVWAFRSISYIFYMTWIHQELCGRFNSWVLYKMIFINFNNLEAIIHYLQNGRITSLGHRDGFSHGICTSVYGYIVQVLRSVMIEWLSGWHDFSKLLCYISS